MKVKFQEGSKLLEASLKIDEIIQDYFLFINFYFVLQKNGYQILQFILIVLSGGEMVNGFSSSLLLATTLQML